MKKPVLRCGDCKQFEHDKDRCAWQIPECKGLEHPFAQECALFTDQNGYAPLLDCDENQLPAWYRQKELFAYERQPAPSTVPVKKKLQQKKRKQKPDQFEILE